MAAHVDEDALTLAIRHVAVARQIVWQQRIRIDRLKALGADATRAEETLRIFESNLKIFEDHEDLPASAPGRFHCGRHGSCSAARPARKAVTASLMSKYAGLAAGSGGQSKEDSLDRSQCTTATVG
jgi:hypothetical protein